MNKKNFLAIGLLLSFIAQINADAAVLEEQIIITNQSTGFNGVGSEQDLEKGAKVSRKRSLEFVDEAAKKCAESIVEDILGADESQIKIAFDSIPDQLAGDREKIYGYVLDVLSEQASNDQRDVFTPAIATRALIVSRKEAIINPQQTQSRWESAKNWALENQKALQTVGILALVFIAGRASAPESAAAPTAEQNAEATRAVLTTGDGNLQVNITEAIQALTALINAGDGANGGEAN